VREAHNNCVNRILKDLQSPEILTTGLNVITADGEKTMQSLWLINRGLQGHWQVPERHLQVQSLFPEMQAFFRSGIDHSRNWLFDLFPKPFSYFVRISGVF
jgi:hypothetical protein